METVREPAVAGTFYPSDPLELKNWLDAELCQEQLEQNIPRMLLLPHAGYAYSGKLAALGISQLQAGVYSRVIILCPAHKIYLDGIALPPEEWKAFSTPLGTIPIDVAALTKLEKQPGVCRSHQAHQFEHAIEVQLPLLQRKIGAVPILPIVVGKCEPDALAKLLRPLLTPETLVIISSDLSHYLNWQEARDLDCYTLAQILTLENNPPICGEQACGSHAINGSLQIARKLHWRPRLLGHHNSGDVCVQRLRVVGYAAIAFYA